MRDVSIAVTSTGLVPLFTKATERTVRPSNPSGLCVETMGVMLPATLPSDITQSVGLGAQLAMSSDEATMAIIVLIG